MKKICLKIIKYFFVFIFSIVLIFNLVYGVCDLFEINTIEKLPISFIQIDGGSMEPDIERGSISVIYKEKYENLKLHDTITFATNDGYTTHKIVSISGKYITTKGTANYYLDGSITEKSYKGKVLFSLKNGAFFVKVLTTPITAILCILLIILLVWGAPILKLITNKNKEKIFNFNSCFVRFVITLCFVSVVVLNPLSSAAKYKEVIDDYSSLHANETYFDSNFLTEDCYGAKLNGWPGFTYDIDFQMNNYANELLFNLEGLDVTYGLWFEKLDKYSITTTVEIGGELVEQTIEKDYLQEYTIEIVPATDSGIIEDPDPNLNETVTNILDSDGGDEWDDTWQLYKLKGMNIKRTHKFKIKIRANDQVNGLYVEGASNRIGFKIHAANSKNTGFHKELSARFVFEVAASNSFIGVNQIVDDYEGATGFGYNIKTNNIAGSGTKSVLVYWDPTICEIDTNQPVNGHPLQEFIDANDDLYHKNVEVPFEWSSGVAGNKKIGYIIVQLDRQANTTLYFVKKDPSKALESEAFNVSCIVWDDQFTKTGLVETPEDNPDNQNLV